MKFKKKRRRGYRPNFSKAYIAERREEMYRLIGKAQTDRGKDLIIKAFEVSINL